MSESSTAPETLALRELLEARQSGVETAAFASEQVQREFSASFEPLMKTGNPSFSSSFGLCSLPSMLSRPR
jgi:hypothetical protein